MSCHVPDLLSDDDIDSSSASDDSYSDSGSSDDNDWPVGLRDVVGVRPTSKDYDKNGMFKTTSDYFTTSDEDMREVMSVTETEPLAGDYISNGHLFEKEANKENIGAAAAKNGGAKKPAPSPPTQSTRKKPLVMDVPPYNRDPATQARNIRNFYRNLLENYTDYALVDVSDKCQEFTLKTRSEVEVAVNVFYDKAVTDVCHAKPLASLCMSMEVHKIHEIILFRETMLSFCQKKFLQIKGDVNVIEEVSAGKFTDCEESDLTFELQNEANLGNWLKWTEVEEKMRCHMIFLGELYNFGELPIKVILGRVLKMFETKGSRHLDYLSIGGLYELLRVAGPKLDVELAELAPDDVIKQYQRTVENLQDLYKDETYPSHVRDKVWEILQLKKAGWKQSSNSAEKKAERAALAKSAKSAGTQKSQTEKAASSTQTDLRKTAITSSTAQTAAQTAAKTAATSSNTAPVGAAHNNSYTGVKLGNEKVTGLNASAAPYVPTSRDVPASRDVRRTSPQSVSTPPQPLVVKPTNQPKFSSNTKIDNQIKDNLSKAWKNVTDCNYSQAISNYKECLVLFNVLSSPHQHMDGTLLCLYVLLTEYETKDTSLETESLYKKIQGISHKTFPIVDYIHLTQLSKGCEDFKVMLTHFVRLNKAVEESWSLVYYPLSQRLLEESTQDKMRDWLKSFVTSQQYAYKDTFKKCVFRGCSKPGLYIVEHEDFETAELYEALECTEKCKQYYHRACFKQLGKWNIDGQCVTPDCSGRIIRLYEKKVVKRESKTPVEPKKGKEKATPHPPQSPRTRKKNKKRQDSGTREKKDSLSETVAAPPKSAPSPPPSIPPTPSPEPEFTGDDVVDMFGTMLIYLEEYPKTHLTTVVMEMNSIYSWVKVEVFNEFLDIGVQSLTISNKGELDLRNVGDEEEEKEKMKDKDISLLINHYKNTPISSLKQKIDRCKEKPAEVDKPSKTSERKKHPSCEKTEKQYKRLTKNSGTKADTKENNPPEQKTDRVQTPDVAAKQRTISGSLNPGAAEFSPPVLAPDSWPQLSRPHHHVQPTPQQIPPNRMHDALLSRATASLSSPVVGAPISVPVNVGAPIRPSQEQASYAERKNLLERISDLELILEETTNKYDKEINHMKTQLVDQLDEHSKLKSKAKQYKQEAKNAQDIVQDFTKLQIDHERILKQMEDERKNWLSERTGKSVESKKLIVTMKIEIEEANKRNRELDTRSVALSKENALLKAKLQQIENELFSRDQATMNLRGDVLDLNEKYKGTQQKHVMERYNTAQLRLRIAYANCEAQIRERAKLENPEFYYLSLWLECQDNIKIRIDDNNHLYKEYVTSLHNSQDMEVKFEQEPPCPAIETAVPMLPLQRFDDILLGRPAPPLPSAPSNYHQNDSELNVLADLMRDTNMASFMAPPDTSQIPHFPNSSHLVPSTPAHLVASTPAIPSSNTHFQFSDLDMPPTNTSTRPPSSGGSSNTSRPPSKPLDLADFMKQQSRQPAAHFQIADTLSPVVSETRQPADNVPDFAIPSSVIPNLSGSNRSSPAAAAITQPTEPSRPPVRGRGRARNQRSGQSTVPSPVVGSNQPVGSVSPRQVEQPTQPKVPGPPATRAPGARSGPERGAALKNRIKEKFSFLSEKEINKYLKRVKEDTDAQGIKVTPTIALLRVSELVELDYPSTPLNTSVPVVPEKTCVICHEGLNLMAVSRLGCGHDFHKKCVDQWFATQNHTCPTCRSHEPPVDMFPPLTR